MHMDSKLVTIYKLFSSFKFRKNWSTTSLTPITFRLRNSSSINEQLHDLEVFELRVIWIYPIIRFILIGVGGEFSTPNAGLLGLFLV